jgi:microcompartment protein CcmL/EutN
MLETTGFTPAMVALDVMEKAAPIRVLQSEINDFLGICIKIVGSAAAVQIAIDQGRVIAERMGGKPVVDIIPGPSADAWPAIESPAEYNPLIQQDVVHLPVDGLAERVQVDEETVMPQASFALGFIETQGFTAVFEAIDTACKAANVEVVGKEKLGGGYVTVVIKGDVAAVKAAVESGKEKVAALGTLIAAHVISRPSESVLALLPKL